MGHRRLIAGLTSEADRIETVLAAGDCCPNEVDRLLYCLDRINAILSRISR